MSYFRFRIIPKIGVYCGIRIFITNEMVGCVCEIWKTTIHFRCIKDEYWITGYVFHCMWNNTFYFSSIIVHRRIVFEDHNRMEILLQNCHERMHCKRPSYVKICWDPVETIYQPGIIATNKNGCISLKCGVVVETSQYRLWGQLSHKICRVVKQSGRWYGDPSVKNRVIGISVLGERGVKVALSSRIDRYAVEPFDVMTSLRASRRVQLLSTSFWCQDLRHP